MEFADVGRFMIRERPNLIEEAIIALTQNSPMIGLTNYFKAGEVGFGSCMDGPLSSRAFLVFRQADQVRSCIRPFCAVH